MAICTLLVRDSRTMRVLNYHGSLGCQKRHAPPHFKEHWRGRVIASLGEKGSRDGDLNEEADQPQVELKPTLSGPHCHCFVLFRPGEKTSERSAEGVKELDK
jgi:hypothetical protein